MTLANHPTRWLPHFTDVLHPDDSTRDNRLSVQVAVCTKWITLQFAPLDAVEPVVMTDQTATVTVGPLRTVESAGGKPWQVHVIAEWNSENLKDRPKPPGTRMSFLKADGTEPSPSGRSGGGSRNTDEYDLRIKEGGFVPAETRLVVRLPAAMEVVPFELHLKDVPVLR